jgi:hypothetical protein
MAHAIEIPMYRLFTDDDHVRKPNFPTESIPRGSSDSKQERVIRVFAKLLSRMKEKDRGLLFHTAAKMVSRA